MMLLDMSTLGAVKEFADQVTREVKVIDVVYLNAGVQNFPGYAPTVSKDGWEETLQVNAWSTVLLGLLLLPWLKVAGRGKARLSFTGSGSKFFFFCLLLLLLHSSRTLSTYVLDVV